MKNVKGIVLHNISAKITFFIFFLLGVVFTYPLIFKFNSVVPGFFSSDEVYGALRQFWWYKYSWFKHISYTRDHFIAVPFGFQHEQIWIYPFWAALAIWLSRLTNGIFTYNLIIFSSLFCSAIFVYYLTYYLTKNIFSGIFSGIVYAFCPYYFVRAWQHLGLTQIQWFPLYVLALFKLRQEAKFKNALICAFAFFIVSIFDNQYAYFTFILTAVFILFLIFNNWKLKIKNFAYFKYDLKVIRLVFLAGILAFLFSLPANYSMISGTIKHPTAETSIYSRYRRPFEDLFSQSARPLSYFLPATSHPLFGKFTERFIGSPLYGQSFTEHTLYLGWIPLILAFIAFRRWKRIRKLPVTDKEDFYIGFFVLLAITAWFFSQPPWWRIGPVKIYMPSFFMYKILPMFRAYCRFGIIVMLAVAVLSGFGLKFILEKFSRYNGIPQNAGKETKMKIAITCIFSGLVLFEFWNWPPFKVIEVSGAPQVYYWIKGQPQDFAIAEYPLDTDGPNELYKFYQTKHEKKIINGTFPGTYANKVANTITKLSDSQTAGILKWMGVKYALVHRQAYSSTGLIDWIEELNKIVQNPGLKFIKSCEGIDTYEVIAVPKEPKLENKL